MNIFINTAYSNIEIFVFKDNYNKLYTKYSQNNHTIVLYELFDEMLQKEKINIQNINAIYIVSGPGSYTGTRVGVIFAKTLAMELGILIYPVGLLHITFLTTKQKTGLDARGNKYFCYDGKDYFILSKEEALNNEYSLDQSINYENIVEKLQNFKSKNVKEITINYIKDAI